MANTATERKISTQINKKIYNLPTISIWTEADISYDTISDNKFLIAIKAMFKHVNCNQGISKIQGFHGSGQKFTMNGLHPYSLYPVIVTYSF